MPLISKIDLQDLITLVREIAISESVSVAKPMIHAQQEDAELRLKKERLLKFEIKYKLHENEEDKMEKTPKEKPEGLNHNPDKLLDTLIERLRLKNDTALSRVLEVAPPVISKIRGRHLPVGSTLLISMYEVSGISIKELRALMGDTYEKFVIRNQGIYH